MPAGLLRQLALLLQLWRTGHLHRVRTLAGADLWLDTSSAACEAFGLRFGDLVLTPTVRAVCAPPCVCGACTCCAHAALARHWVVVCIARGAACPHRVPVPACEGLLILWPCCRLWVRQGESVVLGVHGHCIYVSTSPLPSDSEGRPIGPVRYADVP
jgi:hypothetical protein